MPSAASTSGPQNATERTATLALIFQGIFTGIVRIQAGKQPLSDLDTFRRRMKAALRDVERDALAEGYSSEDLRDAEFAVVALLDESILSSGEPGREQWRTQPLNAELFGEAIAGEVFYDRLHALMRRNDSAALADLMEVYLLCLLLGFEGRMSGPLRADALVLAEKIRRRIEGFRGADYKLSPPLDLAAAPHRAPAIASSERWLQWSGLAVAALIVLFSIYWVTLSWSIERVEQIATPLQQKP